MYFVSLIHVGGGIGVAESSDKLRGLPGPFEREQVFNLPIGHDCSYKLKHKAKQKPRSSSFT